MADFNAGDKLWLEKTFQMSNGYFLDFSNQSLMSFVYDSTKIDMWQYGDISKANRVRRFFHTENNTNVSTFLKDIANACFDDKPKIKKKILEIANNLLPKNLFNNIVLKLHYRALDRLKDVITGKYINEIVKRDLGRINKLFNSLGIKIKRISSDSSLEDDLFVLLKEVNGTPLMENLFYALLHFREFHYCELDEAYDVGQYTSTFCELNEILSPEYQIIECGSNCRIVKKSNNLINPHEKIKEFQYLQEFVNEGFEELTQGKYWKVITTARTIIEITLKEICERFNLQYIEKDIIKALNVVKEYFKMDAKNEDYPDYIKGLISAVSTIVNNIANARNDNSSSHAPKYKPKKHHARFILENAIALSNFLIGIMELKIDNKE